MKIAVALVSAFALASALSGAVPAFAQDHMINGVMVPADQMDAVQARCDELHQGSTQAGGSAPTTNTSNTAGNSTDNAANGSLADTKDASTTTNQAGSDAGDKGQDSNSANTQANTVAANSSAVIDVVGLTAEMCDAGGFGPKM
jgi:hypothetical protein